MRRRWPDHTAKNVAASLGGVSTRTVEKWLAGLAAPSFIWTARMIAAWGPDFLASVYDDPPDWIVKANIEKQRDALARDMAELARRQAALEAQLKN